MYKSRWEIEIFFKLLKNNFKFEYIGNSKNEYIYVINQIIIYLLQIITKIIKNNNKQKIKKYNKDKKNNFSINNTQLLNAIFNNFLENIINGKLDKTFITNLNLITNIIKNKKERSFIRNSKKPFTKWYVKSYSISSSIKKIINAFTTSTIDKLSKNLKVFANKIININDLFMNK